MKSILNILVACTVSIFLILRPGDYLHAPPPAPNQEASPGYRIISPVYRYVPSYGGGVPWDYQGEYLAPRYYLPRHYRRSPGGAAHCKIGRNNCVSNERARWASSTSPLGARFARGAPDASSNNAVLRVAAEFVVRVIRRPEGIGESSI